MRVAIYARYSTDLQSEKSIEDQIYLCREHARREGIEVAATFHDAARSGATMVGRPGLQALLGAILAGEYDGILVEHLDRLSRDVHDLTGIYKRLAAIGAKLLAVHGGEADIMRTTLEGLMGQMWREGNVKKVRRGMAGVVRSGRYAGGRPYGYRPIPGKLGELEIVPAEADIVRRITAEYLAGAGFLDIVRGLNADRIPAPRGPFWRASSLAGSIDRGDVLLLNPLYDGRYIWNRRATFRDPVNGKQRSRCNPESEWHTVEVPHLRILPAETYAALAKAKAERSRRNHRQRIKPRHAFAGLLRCGVCGSGMPVKDYSRGGRARIRCAGVVETARCTHTARVYLDAVEDAVINTLREGLGDPARIERYVTRFNAEQRSLASAAFAEREHLEAKLAAAERDLDRAMHAMIRGTISEAEGDRLIPEIRRARDAMRAAIDASEEPPRVVTLHPAAVAAYMQKINALAAAIEDGLSAGGGSALVLRDLVETITVYPADEQGQHQITIAGTLASLVGPDVFSCGGAVGNGCPLQVVPPHVLPFVFTTQTAPRVAA